MILSDLIKFSGIIEVGTITVTRLAIYTDPSATGMVPEVKLQRLVGYASMP